MTRPPELATALAVLLAAATFAGAAAPAARVAEPAPEITGGGAWINSEPLSLENLRGRVVFVEFWTYG